MDGVSNGGAQEKEVRMRGREKWFEEERMKRGSGGANEQEVLPSSSHVTGDVPFYSVCQPVMGGGKKNRACAWGRIFLLMDDLSR